MEKIEELAKAAVRQGWRVERSRKGTWIFLPPDRAVAPATYAATPSDWRAMRNFQADLKRKGFAWPWPPAKGRE